MIKLDTNSKDWAAHYKIQIEALECPECKNKFEPTLPIAFKGYRGLILADHGCGENMPFRVVPVDDAQLAIWESLRL